MAKKYLLGVDIGTNETKGCLTTLSGEVILSAKREHQLIIPAPGFAEHDPVKQWWPEFVSIISEFIAKAGITSEEIVAVGVSTIMAAVTFLDDNLNPLRNAILYGIDTRSVKEAQELTEAIGSEKLSKICQVSECSTESFGAKILWVKKHEPEVFAKTKHITFASGYINARLTGNFAIDKYSVTSAVPMIDNSSYSWNDEMCSYVCPKSMLPDIYNTTDIIGYVTKNASKETGLREGTPVISGTTDAGAEAVSSGVISPSDTMLMYGSTAFLIHVTEKKKISNRKLWPGPYVLSPYYCECAGTSTAGSITKWIKQQFGKDLIEKEREGLINAFDQLFREAENIPLGSEGLILLPYFLGQRMPSPNPEATGLLIGLTLRHTRGHIVRATFEGIGYNIAEVFSLLGNDSYYKDNVKAIGGGTKTPLWLQIVSDITGVTQVVPSVKIGASYGDALLAGYGVGEISDYGKIKKLIKEDFIIKPDLKKHDEYKKYLDLFDRVYRANKNLMSEILTVSQIKK